MKIDLNEILIENGNYPRVKFQTIFVPHFYESFLWSRCSLLHGAPANPYFLFNIHPNEFFNEQWNIAVWRKGKLKRELITNTNKVNFTLFLLLSPPVIERVQRAIKNDPSNFIKRDLRYTRLWWNVKDGQQEGKERILTVGAHVDRRPCDLGIDESRSHEQNSGEPYTQTSRTHLTNSPDNRHFPRFNQSSALISSSPIIFLPPLFSPSIAHRSAVSSILFLPLL